MSTYSCLIILCIAALLPGGRAQAIESFFMGLGDLPGGIHYSRAYGLSSDGSLDHNQGPVHIRHSPFDKCAYGIRNALGNSFRVQMQW